MPLIARRYVDNMKGLRRRLKSLGGTGRRCNCEGHLTISIIYMDCTTSISRQNVLKHDLHGPPRGHGTDLLREGVRERQEKPVKPEFIEFDKDQVEHALSDRINDMAWTIAVATGPQEEKAMSYYGQTLLTPSSQEF